MAPFFEHLRGQLLIHRMVFNQQDIELALLFLQGVPRDEVFRFPSWFRCGFRCGLRGAATGCQQSGEGFTQFGRGGRFGQVASDPQFATALTVAFSATGREHDHLRGAQQMLCSQLGGKAEPVQ